MGNVIEDHRLPAHDGPRAVHDDHRIATARRHAWRTALATLVVCATGFIVTWHATDGYSAFTLESARRAQALRAPVAVPDLALTLTEGGTRLSDVPGRILLVDFVYTRCTTFCLVLGSTYARLQDRLAPEIAAGKVGLLSISFDPAHDTLDALRAYRARHVHDAAGWTLGHPARPDALPSVLDAFGVVVIPDGFGGYAHNAAVHVLAPDRRLVAIHDLDDIEGVVATVRALLRDAHAGKP